MLCFYTYNLTKVVYPVPATGTRSPRIIYQQSASNNSLAPKPTPKPNLFIILHIAPRLRPVLNNVMVDYKWLLL